MTRVMAVVAHPDDEVIGPGGTLAKHVRAGDDVHVLILAEGKTSRADDPDPAGSLAASGDETVASMAELGITRWTRLDLRDNQLDSYPLLELAQQVSAVVDEFAPEVVYTHHPGDLNIDHELTARACMIACRPHVSAVRWLFAFATLSATDAGYAGRPPFEPSVHVDVTDTLETKLAAMRRYSSELRDFPHPRSLQAMRSQAELFGAAAGGAAAEAFSVIRGTWSPGQR
ncbi:PIG-L deacetylase family protein [Streptomyces sp. CT34]|uniref:PIG-L deacetylase family protein n=1 Tax=Streptomyces sp. CT34 TaxID=1553907 RepID=UPI0005B9DAFD|nr:PIG-L deacetylase family protein [Streptomyces sp. CT34]